jgi:transcriptional regulator with XRE-family HTH domain
MKRITQARLERGWSQSELARRANLNQATVNQVERGRLLPYGGQLEKLARALDIPVSNKGALLEEVPHE